MKQNKLGNKVENTLGRADFIKKAAIATINLLKENTEKVGENCNYN